MRLGFPTAATDRCSHASHDGRKGPSPDGNIDARQLHAVPRMRTPPTQMPRRGQRQHTTTSQAGFTWKPSFPMQNREKISPKVVSAHFAGDSPQLILRHAQFLAFIHGLRLHRGTQRTGGRPQAVKCRSRAMNTPSSCGRHPATSKALARRDPRARHGRKRKHRPLRSIAPSRVAPRGPPW